MVVQWQTKRQAGFTLIEMMVVVAIIGIIAAMAYPNMQRQIAQMKVRDAANMLETTLKQAKSDSLIYQAEVKVTLDGNTVTLEQTGNSNYPQTKTFESGLTLDNTSKVELVFNPKNRTIKPAGTIGFCSTGVNKYNVTFDTIGNINMSKGDTICS